MVPVLTQTPPTISRCSTRITRWPHFAPWIAARWPAGPEPMTIRSYVRIRGTGAGKEPAPSLLSLLHGVEARFYFRPVYDVPPGRHVVRTAILVFEVIGVFPHVQAHHRILTLHNGAVLVGRGDDVDLAAGLHQPRPTGTEA